jgi:ACS family D-galactonate transporter-like MFS transporter
MMSFETLPRGRAWLHVALVFLFMLVNFADKAVVGLSSVPIMRELHLSSTEFGAIGSAFFLLFSVSGIAGGFLADRMRSKTLMLVMAVIWALALLPVSFASSVVVLVASRIVLGAAEGPAFPVALHAVYKWFDDRRRTLPTSIVASGAAFGTGVVAPAIAWLIARYGWHAAFGCLAAAGLAWAGVWFCVAEEGPLDERARFAARDAARDAGRDAGRDAERDAEPTAEHVPYRRLILSRTAIGVFLAGFAAYWIIALNITWLANYLMRALELRPATAAWIVGLPSVMQIVLAPCLAGFSQWLIAHGVSSRIGRGVLGSACVVLAGGAMMGMTVGGFGPFKVLLIGIAFSLGSVIFTVGSTLIGEISPPAQRGAMLGVTNSIHTTAGLLAPWLMGRIVDVGTNPLLGFTTGYLWAGAGVAILGLISAFLIQPEADLRRLRRFDPATQ